MWWPYIVGGFILICAVFIVLAWRMDRKRKWTVTSQADRGVQDQHIAETMFGDEDFHHGQRENPGNLP
jgi:hypothetical protein